MSELKAERFLAVLAACVLAVSAAGCGSAENAAEGTTSSSGYTEEQVKLRDITTYHSFTGTIAPVTERNVLPDLTGVKVTAVYVEKGDEVQAGDVLMTLDADSLNEQIVELQASIDAAKANSDASIQSAQSAYSNYQRNLNDGLDASIQSAKSQMDSAQAQLVLAQQAYNSEVDLNNQQLSQAVMSAKQQVDAAYGQLQTAIGSLRQTELALQQAQDGLEQAKSSLQKANDSKTAAENAYNAAVQAATVSAAGDTGVTADAASVSSDQAGTIPQTGSTTDTAADIASAQQTLTAAVQAADSAEQAVKSAQQQVDSASLSVSNTQVSVDNAQTSYDNAVQSYEAAKQGEENQLTTLYDQLIQAQTSYVNSVDAYNAAVRSSENQLQTYANQVDTAKAASDQTSNELRLADLQNQLDDCDVKAPIAGVVTALNVTEGDVVASAQPAAVITNFDKMKIDIKINEYDILGVEEGKAVTINIDALDKDYDGTIETISRVATVEGGVSYFESEVDFNGDEDARSGMSAEVRMVVNQSLNATSVHSDAIQTADDGTTYVYEYADDRQRTMKQVPVTIGVSDGTYTEVTEGLYPGDTILYKPSTSSLEDLRGEMTSDSD